MSKNDPRPPLWRAPLVPIWRAPARIACRGEDTALFYPAERESTRESNARIRKAKAICAGCCARTECLEAAMAEEGGKSGRYGIRGGLTPEERKSLKQSLTLKEKHRRAREAKEAAAGTAA